MKIQTICFLSLFMVTLMTASGLRVKKQAGICAAAGIPSISTETVIDTVEEVVEHPKEIDDIIAFVEETTVATKEEVAELVNEVAHTPEEVQELTELINDVVTVVEAEEVDVSTGVAIEAATEVVEGHHNTAEIVTFIEEHTVATPEEVAELVAEVTTDHHQAEELTEIIDSTIQVIGTNPDVFEELHEEVINNTLPPVEVREVVETTEHTEEAGEETVITEVGEPVYYYEEASIERPEIYITPSPIWNYEEGTVETLESEIAVERPEIYITPSPVWNYEEGTVETIEGETVVEHLEAEAERPEIVIAGGNGQGLPPVEEEESGEATWFSEVGEPVYFTEEASVMRPEIMDGGNWYPQEERIEMVGGEGSLPPVWTYEEGTVVTEVGEPVYFTEEATIERPEIMDGGNWYPQEERIEMVGGEGSLPPVWTYEEGTVETVVEEAPELIEAERTEEIITGGNGQGIPPVEEEESGEATWFSEVGEPVYFTEEATIERPEIMDGGNWYPQEERIEMVGGEGSLPPVWTYEEGTVETIEGENFVERPEIHITPPIVWNYEEGTVVTEVGEPVYFTEEATIERPEIMDGGNWYPQEERIEMVGGEGSLPPVWTYEEGTVETVVEEAPELIEAEGPEITSTGGNGQGLPPVEEEESGEETWITEVGEPVYFTEEASVMRPEIMDGGDWWVGGPDSLPPWLRDDETTEHVVYIPGAIESETVSEVVSNPVDVETVTNFIEETTIATPGEVAQLISEVTENHHEAEELAELIREVVEVVEVEEQEISTPVAIDTATEIVTGGHNADVVTGFLEETTVATPEEVAELVAEVTTNHHQAEELTEVIYETVDVIETEAPVETLPFPLPTPVIDDTPAFCHA